MRLPERPTRKFWERLQLMLDARENYTGRPPTKADYENLLVDIFKYYEYFITDKSPKQFHFRLVADHLGTTKRIEAGVYADSFPEAVEKANQIYGEQRQWQCISIHEMEWDEKREAE
jgi:hypothetical protein